MYSILKTMLVVLTCLHQSVAFSQSNLLWNPGPKYRAGVHANNSNGGKCEIVQISEMYELSAVGSPIGWSAPVLCGPPPIQSPLSAGNAQSPSFYHVTEGWKSTEFGVWPGWAVYHMSGGAGSPIETRLLSNSFASADPCTLREVSQTYKHFTKTNSNSAPPNLGFWSFKQEYSIGSFAQLHGSFDARLNRTLGPPKCAQIPSAIVSTDLVIEYLDAARQIVRRDVLGIIIFNMNNYDMNGNFSDKIFYSNRTSVTSCTHSDVNCIVLLHGNKLGYATMNGNYQHWNIEYKTLVAQYLPPPPVNSTSVIASWEIYPSTRGADIEIDVKNMELIGQ